MNKDNDDFSPPIWPVMVLVLFAVSFMVAGGLVAFVFQDSELVNEIGQVIGWAIFILSIIVYYLLRKKKD